jgi:hypothetical protein
VTFLADYNPLQKMCEANRIEPLCSYCTGKELGCKANPSEPFQSFHIKEELGCKRW